MESTEIMDEQDLIEKEFLSRDEFKAYFERLVDKGLIVRDFDPPAQADLGDIKNIVENLVIDMGGIEISPFFKTISVCINTMSVTKVYDEFMTSTLDNYRRTPILLYLAFASNKKISEQRALLLFGVIDSEIVRADWNELSKNLQPNNLSSFKSILVSNFDRLDRITLKLISDLGGLLQPWPELEAVLMTKLSRGTEIESCFEILRNFGSYKGESISEIKQMISNLFCLVFNTLMKHVMAAKTVRKMLQLQPLQNREVRRFYMFYLVHQYNDVKLCRSAHKSDMRLADVSNDDELIDNMMSVRAKLILIEKSDDCPDDNLVKNFRRMLPIFQRDVISEEHKELVNSEMIKVWDDRTSDRFAIKEFKRIVLPLIRELQPDERMSFSTPLQKWSRSRLFRIVFSKDQLNLLLPKLMKQILKGPDILAGYKCWAILIATHLRHFGECRGKIIRKFVKQIGKGKLVSDLKEMSKWISSLGENDDNKSEDERFRKRPILLYLCLAYTLELDDENDAEEKLIESLRTINLDWLRDEYESLEKELSPIRMDLLREVLPFMFLGGLTCPKLRRNAVTMVASLINSSLFGMHHWDGLRKLMIAKLDSSDADNRFQAVALLNDILLECTVKQGVSDLIGWFFPQVLPLLWFQKSEDAARLLMFMLNYDSKQTNDRRVRHYYMKLLACMYCSYDVKGREAELRNMRKVLERFIAIDESQPDQDYKLLKKIRKELFGSTMSWDWIQTYGQGLTINIEKLKFKVKEPMEMRPYPVRAIQRGPTNKPFLPS